MPLRIYCTKCSESTEYTLNKPIYCASCGNKFGETVAAKTSVARNNNTKSTPNNSAPIQKIPLNIEENLNIEDIQLDVSVESFGERGGVKFEDLAKQPKTGFKRILPKRVNLKKAIAEFQREARPKTRQERESETVSDIGEE